MKILFNTTFYNTNNRTANKYNTNFKAFNAQTITKDTLESLIEQGLSAPKIAKALNLDVSQVIPNLKRYGLETKPRQAYYELIDNIEELLRQGLSTTAIGKLYGMNRRDVYEVAVKVLGQDGFKDIRSLFIRRTGKRTPSEVARQRISKVEQNLLEGISCSELIMRLHTYLAKLCNVTNGAKIDVPELKNSQKMSIQQQEDKTSEEILQLRELFRNCVIETLANKKSVVNIAKDCGITLPMMRKYVHTLLSPSELKEAKQLVYERQQEQKMQKINQREALAKQKQVEMLSNLKSLVENGFSNKKIEMETGCSIKKIVSVIGQEAYEKLMQQREQAQLKLIFSHMASGVPNDLIAKALGLSKRELASIVAKNKSNIDAFLN